MKSTILLATAIFLVSAPPPDSQSVSEMSAGFLVAGHSPGLMAAEQVRTDKRSHLSSYEPAARPPADEPVNTIEEAEEKTGPELAQDQE
jgi:hypothetical protein